MKKTFTINISGNIFHIDEDAYEKLQQYLHIINTHFGITEEGREIVIDIESRISEIFQEKIAGKDQVISLEMVEEVITIMGTPEEIIAEEEDIEQEEAPQRTAKRSRRLYRDPDHRVLGGVASGVASYFGIDVVIIRLLFIALFIVGYGSSFLIYIILWIVVPKATTTKQKLEMKGEDINISNIEKSIKEEYSEVKENFNQMRSKSGPQTRDFFDKFIDFLGTALHLSVKIILIILGVGFIFIGFASLIGIIGSLIFAHSYWIPISGLHVSGIPDFSYFYTGNPTILIIGVLLVIGIPLLLLIFAGLKMVFKFKTDNTIIGLSALGAWVVGIILILTLGIGQLREFRDNSTQYSKTHTLSPSTCDTLYLKTIDNVNYDSRSNNIYLDNMKVISKEGARMLIGETTFDVEESLSKSFEIKIRRKSRGKNQDDALNNAKSIQYKWIQTDSLIRFHEYFTLPQDKKWRNQKLHITLKVPQGKVIYLDKSMRPIIHDIDNVNDTWDPDMLGRKWIMKEDGLTLYQHK